MAMFKRVTIFNRAFHGALILLAGLAMASCGGGGSSSGSGATTTTQASNEVAVTVAGGPNGNAVNTLYTTVTICQAGTTTCQTIDNIQVDTGSYGLRVLASVLTLSLPVATATDGNSLVECTKFVDGYSWGPVSTADVEVGGEKASSVPVQVIGSSSFATVPSDCSSAGKVEDTVASFGANGILGIGVFEQDCGDGCADSTQAAYYGNYYSCTSTACNIIAVPLTSQVLNPIPLFTTDNNGSIIVLPSVAAGGAATATGSLYFGIDTESNNASGSRTVLTLDGSGYFTTTFNGLSLTSSFIDSGSNGLFFNDDNGAGQSNIAVCSSSDFSDFYCPASTVSLSATLTGQNGVSATASFSVENAETIADANPTYAAFSTLGGEYSSSTIAFDWGLPFFYGRSVYNAIENHSTTAGTGPYVAF